MLKKVAAKNIAGISIVIACLLLLSVAPSGAVWNEDAAVHIDPAGIENSTLIVGTHLIHLSALTDTLYDVARQSAEESGQDGLYYKSELAGGVWFNISAASSLADITTAGAPVNGAEIAALFLTHHTKSDGVTYDLRLNTAVNIFDIYSPYDLESMEELLPLKTQYDLTRELQSESDFGRRSIEIIAGFFRTSVRNDVTQAADEGLAALQAYLDVLTANDADPAAVDTVQSVMAALDASRRAEVMSILDGALENLAISLQSLADAVSEDEGEDEGEGEDEEEEDSSAAGASDSNLQTAVNDSLSNVTSSYNLHSGQMLSAGATIMAAARYEISLRLIADAESVNHGDCDVDVSQIVMLDNIQNSRIADQTGERVLLDERLLPEAAAAYLAGLSGGENAEYAAAAAQNAAAVLLNSIRQKARNLLTVSRSELEFFINAAVLRLDGEGGLAFLDDRLALTEEYAAAIPADAFAETAGASLAEHIDFLTRLRRSVELLMGGNEADKLQAQKDALRTELLSALDNDDLAAAQLIQARIADIDAQIADLPGGAGGAAGISAAAAAVESAAAAKSLISELSAAGAGGAGANGGDMDDLLAAINALGGLLPANYAAVFPLLEDLRADMTRLRDLEGREDFAAAIATAESLIMDNRDAYNQAAAGGLSAAAAKEAADMYFSGDSGGVRAFDAGVLGESGGPAALSPEAQSAVLVQALAACGAELADENLAAAARGEAQRQMEAGNPLVFQHLEENGQYYIPARVVAAQLKMRYVWNSNLNGGALARGGDYYFFTVYSTEIVMGPGADDLAYMAFPAKYREELYLPVDYTFETFGLRSEPAPGTDYAFLVTAETDNCAAELLSRLLRAAGTN
ncbi:MAG: hypothetical protein LBK56_12015 [Gracilibacteraceae bacterium]|jgi:hypothetical protein|nr:hypothetical protein [Gracilibacteraceae bacterium]